MTVRALAMKGMAVAAAVLLAGGCAALDGPSARPQEQRPVKPDRSDQQAPDRNAPDRSSVNRSAPDRDTQGQPPVKDYAAEPDHRKLPGDGNTGTGGNGGDAAGSPAEAGTPGTGGYQLPRSRAFAAPQVPDDVRGIYVSGWIAGSGKMMERLIRLVDETDLNAMVIDVKNDYGKLTYRSSLPEVRAVGADSEPQVRDMAGLLRRLKAKRIYTIGRVVVFKDPLLARAKPNWAFHTKAGALWRDRKGKPWVEPYRPEVRDYNIAIAKEAAALGFDEIQFDYVRFPDNGEEMDRIVRYRNPEGWTKREAIGRFLRDARDALHAEGTAVSADVFGLVTTARDDMGIGQTWREIAPAVDVISPMVYPSHYAPGTYGVRHPDLDPSAIVRHALEDAGSRNRVLSAEGRKPAGIRPWLQAFTATWLSPHQLYRAEEIREQIRAAEASGVRQFLLWNPSCTYDYR